MNNVFLTNIDRRKDYLDVIEAITRTKQSFTEEEKGNLFDIYKHEIMDKLGFRDETLVRAFLAIDTAPDKAIPSGSPLAAELSTIDRAALDKLVEMCMDQKCGLDLALSAKETALREGVNIILALGLARASLNIFAWRKDIAPYRDDINDLISFLNQSDDDQFHEASSFLIQVQMRVGIR